MSTRQKQILVMVCLCLVGCTTPSQRFNEEALNLGFKVEVLSSERFQHNIYLAENFREGRRLHVYLDGDGTPWKRNRWIAKDPTARNPLILYLMKQDNTPSILLGRPCYYGFSAEPECDGKLWTSHRYSKEVVDSMVEVLNTWLKTYDFNEVVLIGYSGGGSLSILMAESVENVKKVVTIAGNLDVKAWSEFHGYLALKDSLNPAKEVALNSKIKQFHFAGKEDEIVPAFIIKEFAGKQINSKYYELEDKDHSCCWDEVWNEILRVVDQ